ncbi:glycine oxidase ThiO [Leptolyngbya sp. 'hensonii']|uniref:glycine oxidase ThiO n=1 Tax=Leptolyngbya sp. 'hensonii' TaxID=1922337 RepID=UPI00095010A4|nr:glycine oxidase ThiO [Leptolyngbya sp. 'hensonii']OLP20319.1 glycine oxidase ThiO [Leptolyngbya sp. 'hensonii']
MTGEIIVIGGGIMGLSIAIELRLRGMIVTLISRNVREAAAYAAAGMLAPQAEAIPSGPMLDLCLRSRALYPEWVGKLETLTGLDTGYWPCGILAPVYDDGIGELDRSQIDHHQDGLGPDVAGGWWFPEDGQVDTESLMRSLQSAAQEIGVHLQEGVIVQTLRQQAGRVTGLTTSAGEMQAEHYILATGAWSADLVPVPVSPTKGQMLSLRVPVDYGELPLQKVLFGPATYIVPRRDGRIIIGATSEEVGFTPHNTPAGMQALLQRAIRLYPLLQDFPIQEFWWGFRPATPDENPILGPSAWENLTLATGHYRNGILLAPVTAQMISALVLDQQVDPLLPHFHYDRFS